MRDERQSDNSGHGGRLFSFLCGSVSIFLVTYSIARAWALSLVHDEATTFLMYVIAGPAALLDCYNANNHFLNTIMMYIACKLFGNGEVALRIPNLLAHMVYMFFAFRMVRKHLRPFAAFCGFLVLNINPFVVDFFSLARGYGIAMACMMAGLYFFVESIMNEWPDKRRLLVAFWCGGLSAFANLTFLNFLAGMLCAYFVIDLYRLLKSGNNAAYGGILPDMLRRTGFFYKHVILMAIVLCPLAFNLNREKALYYGGNNGFWQDTVGSLLSSSAYGMDYARIYSLMAGAVVVIVMLSAAFVLWRKWRLEGIGLADSVSALVVMTVTSVLLTILQHYLFGVPYPMDRTAIVLLVLFSVLSVLMAGQFVTWPRQAISRLANYFLAVSAVGMILHAALSFNLSHTFVWKYNADIKQMLSDVGSDLSSRGVDGRITLGISWVFEPSINYYYVMKRHAWLPVVTREGIKGYSYDYYFVLQSERAELMTKSVEIIREYSLTGNILARRR